MTGARDDNFFACLQTVVKVCDETRKLNEENKTALEELDQKIDILINPRGGGGAAAAAATGGSPPQSPLAPQREAAGAREGLAPGMDLSNALEAAAAGDAHSDSDEDDEGSAAASPPGGAKQTFW